MSENGKWLARTIAKYADDGWGAIYGLERYNLETDELEEYWYGESVGECHSACIANDDTMTGWSGRFNEEESAIWKAGSAEPQSLSIAFPEVQQFTEFDAIRGHKPCAISADGRYIVGYGYYSRTNAETEATTEGYESYIFDTTAKGATTAINAAPNISKKTVEKVAAARYDLIGKMMDSRIKGINILKPLTGKAIKIMEKIRKLFHNL